MKDLDNTKERKCQNDKNRSSNTHTQKKSFDWHNGRSSKHHQNIKNEFREGNGLSTQRH